MVTTDMVSEINLKLAPYKLCIEYQTYDNDPVELFTLYSIVVDKIPLTKRVSFNEAKEKALYCVGSIVLYKIIK